MDNLLLIGGAYFAYRIYKKLKYNYDFGVARSKFKPFSCGELGVNVKDETTQKQHRLYTKTECAVMNYDSFYPEYGFEWMGYGDEARGGCYKAPSKFVPQMIGGSFSYECAANSEYIPK